MSHSTGRVQSAVIAALAVVALMSPAPAAFATKTDAPSGWHVAATLALGTDHTAISCGSATTCWSIEAGQLLSTANGGATWTTRNALVPAEVAALNDIACPTDRLCYLIATTKSGGTELLVRRGNVITASAVGDGTPWLAIACPGPRHCLATDGTTVFTTRNGGATWAQHALPQILYGGEPGLGCATGTDRCWAVGDRGETPIIERTVDDGATWTPQNAPGTTDGLYTVACPDANTCYAGGATFSDDALVLRTTNGGDTWSFTSVPFQSYAVRSLSCASVTECWAAGQGPGSTPFVFATTDGQHWGKQSLPVGPTARPVHVACPTETHCAAVAGGIAFVTDDAGAMWNAQAIPAAVEAPQSLTCPSSTNCVGVGNDAVGRPMSLTSADGGSHWAAHALPPETGTLLAVDCASTSDCEAVATSNAPGTSRPIAQALWSIDGGVSWTAGRVKGNGGVLRKLTCPSPSTCLAIGYDAHSAPKVDVTTDGGHTWNAVAAPADVFSMDAIGCRAVTACVLIAHAANEAPLAFTTSDLGVTFESHALPYVDGTDNDFTDLDCAGTTCVAVGLAVGDGVIMRSKDGGATWKAATVPAAAQSLGTVSCGSTTSCAAAAYDYREGGGPIVVTTTDSGKTWSPAPVPARNEEPIDIACRRTGCIASDVSDAGNPLILSGGF